MFAARTAAARVVAHTRGMASETGAGDAAGSAMDGLLAKLAAITNETAPRKKSAVLDAKKPAWRSAAKTAERSPSTSASKGNYNPSKKYRNNSNRRPNMERENRMGFNGSRNDRGRATVQTVSHFDRIKNPKAAAGKKSAAVTGSSSSGLNSDGLSLADMHEQRALFIRRKLESPSAVASIDNATFPAAQVVKFIASRISHNQNIYSARGDKFAQFKHKVSNYTVPPVSKAELELVKDKMGYDTKSRVLRALEQITTKRGFKLLDAEKRNVPYLPYSSMLYPYANTLLPNNLRRPVANLKNLSNVSKEEIAFTIATVVKGKRQELHYDASKTYSTPQAKVNAQVVVNSLNRNAQLQVDNIHYSLAPTMLGEAPVNNLPRATLPPKKL